jgi:UDP-N-acetylmuramate--alanine ligase
MLSRALIELITTKSDLKSKPSVFLIGIGGIGISALARYFLSSNWEVSGSDGAKSDLTEALEHEGARITYAHEESNIKKTTDLVVFSNAIAPENPERKRAERLGIPSLSYPEAVGALTQTMKTVAIAGAHGKSTTTALVASILLEAKKDPTVIIGVKMKELGNSNFRAGSSNILVLEADEYARAFLNYESDIAVITNIDREHLDVYRDLTDIKKTYREFLAHVRPHGTLILNAQDENTRSLEASINRMAQEKKLNVIWYTTISSLQKILKIAGAHNLGNASAAYHATLALGIPPAAAKKGLAGYRGAWRRMEYKGSLKIGTKTCRVFDDYGHHPSEIRATINAFKSAYPNDSILCVFQPHQAKRLAALFKEFQSSFDSADAVIILPTYVVRGRDAQDERFTAQQLAEKVRARNPKQGVFYCSDSQSIAAPIKDAITGKSGLRWIIVMMGAGDIAEMTAQLFTNHHG